MGKGSNRRKEDTEKIRNNWDAIFGRKDKEPKEPAKNPEQKDAK